MERVDENTTGFELGQSREQVIGHDLEIRPHARECRAQYGALEHPERVIRYRYHRAGGRNPREIRGVHLARNLKLSQEAFKHRSRAGASRFLIRDLQAIDLEELFD